MANATATGADTVELQASDGVAFIEQASPLTRLHYFDGKFLRADAFALEQDYHRQRTRLANLAGGWGVVHGLGIALSGDRLEVGAGLAVTAAGNFVLATGAMQAPLAELLQTATPAPIAGSAAFADCPAPAPAGLEPTAALAIYEITVAPVEGLCGNEPVYGKLCDTACASDSRHPYWREGVLLRLRPIGLQLPASSSVKPAVVHLRNRVASAYFAVEPGSTPGALSASGLASGLWCEPAGLYGRDEVVIGLLAREGGVNRVIDAWAGRRERMDTQARGHWQGRMAMRPWPVFIAQILQFQCQLSGLFEADQAVIRPADDCDPLRQALARTRHELEALMQRYGNSTRKLLQRIEGRPTIKEFQRVADEVASSFADIDELSLQLADPGLGQGALPAQRMLLGAGFFELPPAGYLPVDPRLAVEDQLQRMMGEGVRLQFHAVRSDEIAHLVEQAQHLQRISLTRGLDDAKQVERVEVFVPDGELRGVAAVATGTWWRLDMQMSAVAALFQVAPATSAAQPQADTAAMAPVRTSTDSGLLQTVQTPVFDGIVRTESRTDGSQGAALVASTELQLASAVLTHADSAAAATQQLGLYLSADIASDPFALPVGGAAAVQAELRSNAGGRAIEMQLSGRLTMLSQRVLAAGPQQRLVQLDLQIAESSLSVPAQSRAQRLRLLLQREGDSRTGLFIVDDERNDPASSPIEFDWDDSPRRAAMFIVAADAAAAMKRRLASIQTGEFAAASADSNTAAAATRQRLLGMSALDGAPDPTSALGAAALNTLVALADASDDAAFLARSRRRLLPTLDAPKTLTVRALQDWVMFRRARTALCGPACTVQPSLGLEAFQVWHLRLADAGVLPKLAAALDKGDDKALAGFAFKRVGVLRYRDESAFAEESADRVLAMWSAARPPPQVALGRVWESEPATGQGWQNHFRLRNMLEQISKLTAPPPRGGGALAAIPAPASRLADGALDGGMLVVTVAAELRTRSALLIYGNYDSDQHYLQKDAPRATMSFADDQPQGSTLGDFVAALNANQPVLGVTLATTAAAPDAGAAARLQAVVAALQAAGKPAPAAGRQKTSSLSSHDHDQLSAIGLVPEQVDEVVFFELNAGA